MTDNTEREWPTFGDILSELDSLGHLTQAPTAPTPEALAAEIMADHEGAGITFAEPVEQIAVAPEPLPAPIPVVQEAPEPLVAEPAPEVALPSTITPGAQAIDHSIVVPILPPSTLDTSLLAPSTDDIGGVTFDTSALEPLAPAPDMDVDALPEPTFEAVADVDVPDAGSVFEAPAFEAPTFETPAFEAPTFETPAFEAPAFEAVEPMAFEPVEVETPDLLSFEAPEEPLISDVAEPMAFEPVEVETPTLLSFEPSSFETPDFAEESISMDWAEVTDSNEATSDPGAVFSFEPDASDIAASAAMDAPVPAEEDFTSTQWSMGGDEAVADNVTNFDSVATADAIESDLQDLFALDQSVSEENFDAFMGDAAAPVNDAPVADVVPLHPVNDGKGEAAFGLDAVFDPEAETVDDSLQSWVGIQDDEDTREDPWAYMRPDEAEDVKGGFWSSRPKFFGGNERKAKKAARQQAAAQQEMRSNQTGPTCPNCSEIGQIDLDDPVGGKIHASCQHCGHVWSQASDADLHIETA